MVAGSCAMSRRCFGATGGTLSWRDDAAAALLDAYQRVRPLAPSERRQLLVELRLAAIRFAASRLKDFGLPQTSSVVERRALDPQDYVDRLAIIEGGGDRHVAQLLQRRL